LAGGGDQQREEVTLLQIKQRRWARVLPALGIATIIGSATVVASAVDATASGAASAQPAASAHAASGAVTDYSNKLNRNTKGWCTYGQGCNGQVGSGDYGTIDVVSEHYSNDGGYAPAVKGPNKTETSYARISGAGGDQETSAGCPAPGDENCTGPYILFGGHGTYAKFPKNGVDSSIQVYLDPTWAAANPGQVIDWDVSLNNNTGAFLEDFVFNLCSTANDGGGYYVSTSNGAGGCSTGPTEVTTAGWYTFETQFSSVGAAISVNYILINPSGATSLYQLEQPGIATRDAGGPNYGWFPDEDALGLPIANDSLTVGR
jgi:hypothetical protein